MESESLVTIVIPREKLAEAKRLPNIPMRGIYYLLDEDHGNLSRVYAGQTTRGIARLEEHKSAKEFWNKAVMFLDDEVHIDRDVLDALELEAIKYIRTHGEYEADNAGTPSPVINPYKEQSVQRLHEQVLYRMKVLGFDLDRVDKGPEGTSHVFRTHKNGVVGIGHYVKENGHFVVHAGSQVDLKKPIIKNASAMRVRRELFGDTTEIVMLGEDCEFTSPSTAAVFVLGGSQNGWTEWKDSQGNTLDTVYRTSES